MDEQALRNDLLQLRNWLCQLLEIDALDVHLSTQEPLSATYKWQGQTSAERFLLALKLKSQQLTLFHLWLPLSKQKQGVGTAIVNRLRELCAVHRVETILIEPRPGSEGFWTKLGFVAAIDDRFAHWCLRING